MPMSHFTKFGIMLPFVRFKAVTLYSRNVWEIRSGWQIKMRRSAEVTMPRKLPPFLVTAANSSSRTIVSKNVLLHFRIVHCK